jgi:cold-inducible RNA-binding protein
MGSKLYVGNLNYNTSEDDIRNAFSADGHQVMSVAIITDRDTGRPKGFAFVEMASEQDAAAVIDAWNGRELDGRPLRVNEAQDKPRRSFGGGGGGGGGGYGGGGGGGYGGGGGGYGGGRNDRGGRGRI